MIFHGGVGDDGDDGGGVWGEGKRVGAEGRSNLAKYNCPTKHRGWSKQARLGLGGG